MTRRRKWIVAGVVALVVLLLLWRGQKVMAATLGMTGVGTGAGPGVDPPAGYHWAPNTTTEGGPWVLVKDDASAANLESLMVPSTGDVGSFTFNDGPGML